MSAYRLKVTRSSDRFYVTRMGRLTGPTGPLFSGGHYSHKAAVTQMENLAVETGEEFTRYSYADAPTQYVVRVVEFLRDQLGIADITSDRDTVVVPVPDGTSPSLHADAVVDVVNAAVTMAKRKEQG